MLNFIAAARRLFTSADWQRRGLLGLVALLLAASPVPLALREDFRTAQAAAAHQDYAAAAEALADAAERLPYVGGVAYQAGLAEISASRFEMAIRHIQAAAELDGWDADKRVALGDAYFGKGDRPAATEQWALALAERPTDAGLLQRLANNYEASGRYTETIALLGSLVALGQASPEIYYRLALLTAATAPSEALARLAVVAEIAPAYAANAEALRQAIETGLRAKDEAYTFGLTGVALIQLQEWALAEMALTRAVELNPNFARAHAYLGLALDEQDRDGRAAYETALKLEPASPWINYLLGLHWRRAGDGGAAIDYFKRALALDAQNPAFAAELANTYTALNDLTEAERWFREAVRLAPQDAHFWLLLARFYCDQNYHVAEEGLPAARQAVGLAPTEAAAVDALGCALFLTGDQVNAEKNVQRALSLDPNLPSAYYHLGQIYLQQGKTAEAEFLFNHTLGLDPQGPYGNQAFQALAQMSSAASTPAAPATATPP